MSEAMSFSRGKKPQNGYSPLMKRPVQPPPAPGNAARKPPQLQKAASAPGLVDNSPPPLFSPPGGHLPSSHGSPTAAVVVPSDVPPLPPSRAFSQGSRTSCLPFKMGTSKGSPPQSQPHRAGAGWRVGDDGRPAVSSKSIAAARLALSPTKLGSVSETPSSKPPGISATMLPLPPPPTSHVPPGSRPQPPSKPRRPNEYLVYHPFQYETPGTGTTSTHPGTRSRSRSRSRTPPAAPSPSTSSSATAFVHHSSPVVHRHSPPRHTAGPILHTAGLPLHTGGAPLHGAGPPLHTAGPAINSPLSPTQGLQPVTFARPPPREMEYTEREHPRNTFEYMNLMRTRGDLCDVTLIVDTKEIRAHKVVLAACSQYFEQMFIGEFAEPEGEPIFVDEVEEDALMALIDFSYTSRITLTDHNIYSVFEAADLLQFAGVKGACFKFFKQQINKSNCVRTWLFAESHNCTELLEAAVKYIECNFLDIVRGREFLSLDQPDVVARIAALEDLAITSEEQVYEAVLGWLHHEHPRRKAYAPLVFKSVRFPSMSRDYLMHIVDNEPFIKEDPDCLQQLIEALEMHVSSVRLFMRRKLKKEGNYSNLSPRPASMAVEVVEIYRQKSILGLRIMGGSDRPNHVFRQGDKSGIFILKVTPDGAAAKVGKLRSGDRILRVNESDVTKVTHDQAIKLLKLSPDPLRLLIRHEPPPTALEELTLVTRPGEGFGFSICGGVNGYPGNPLDETDEGIFISQIIPGGAAEQDSRLKVGTRILQVNSVSLLGRTQDEALKVLHGVLDRINLLVCHGYNPEDIPDTIDTVDEFGYVGSEPLYEPSTPVKSDFV